jgi:hypothetical protein
MIQKITARKRFREVFEHNIAELDRLPKFSLRTPPQGLIFKEWEKVVTNDDIPEEYVRITPFDVMREILALKMSGGFPDLVLTKILKGTYEQ